MCVCVCVRERERERERERQIFIVLVKYFNFYQLLIMFVGVFFFVVVLFNIPYF